ncbi:MAG: Ku protein [Acidobacteriota bacterium]
MVGRPFWSGQLKISLVSFGVQLYPAVNAQAGISFHQIDKATGQRVRHMNVVNQDQPVENAEIVKGYEYTKGKYVVIDPEEIKHLRVATKKVIEVKQFVDLSDLSPALFEKPYFVLPDPKQSHEAYAVVREAMKQSGKAAVGEVAFGGREHLVAFSVPPGTGRGMMAYTMRYAEEMRKAEEYFSSIAPVEIDKKQLAMAADLVEAYSAPFHFDEYKDDYEAALHELVEAKQKNMPLPLEEEAPRPAHGIGLMDALRRSLEEAKPAAPQRKKPPASDKSGPMLVKNPKRKHKAA